MARSILAQFSKNLQPETIFDNLKNKKFNKNDLFDSNVDCAVEIYKTGLILTKHGFSKKTIQLTKNYCTILRKDLRLTDSEFLVLNPFLIKSRAMINVDGLVKYVNGHDGLAINLYQMLFSLYRKNFLYIFPADGDVHFAASIPLQNYLAAGEWKPETKQHSLKQIIREIDTIANLYNNYKPFAAVGEFEILNILSKNKNYEYCKVLLDAYEDSIKDTHYHELLFYILGHMILTKSEMKRNNEFIEIFCRFDETREYIIDDIFQHDSHPLFKKKIFDRGIDESGKADSNSIEIHADFKRKFLRGIIKEKQYESVIKSDKIVKKELFFNDENKKQIDDLTSMLQPTQFTKIKKRLQKAGTITGFACLFSGESGTGKTAASLKIAKDTGRDIIKVDMSSLRSKWWGEDEKNVKAIFSNYEAVLQDSKLEPILLLNEADAMIGKRLDVNGTNSAIISSINATQNIILEELENFNGILIATTNLTQNMDSAFERRFLYKIEFEKPSIENRAKIWEKLLNIDGSDALILASKFDFTGAAIENIFRKKVANAILYGDNYNLDQIIELCKQEKIEKEVKIGFGS
jgi:SpoVK/Ycf46/Vps4 family AAA+-type ATPase